MALQRPVPRVPVCRLGGTTTHDPVQRDASVAAHLLPFHRGEPLLPILELQVRQRTQRNLAVVLSCYFGFIASPSPVVVWTRPACSTSSGSRGRPFPASCSRARVMASPLYLRNAPSRRGQTVSPSLSVLANVVQSGAATHCKCSA